MIKNSYMKPKYYTHCVAGSIFGVIQSNGDVYPCEILKDSLGKFVVIYFYPKDDTPGCTLETKDFNSFYNKFKKLNCEVYGISKDTIESHSKFKKKKIRM